MILATAGHVDHGKTLLVKALTGTDTDRLPEEKRRGLTIDLGFAYRDLPSGRRLGFVDVPGHERFVHNMLAGVSIVDFALIVVAADDGPMPQTHEHVAILDLLGIRSGAVALTKIDRVDGRRVDAVQAETIRLLSGTGLAGAPVFPVSGVTGEGITDLFQHLEAAAAALAARPARGNFRLAIDRCFTVAGAGLVATGAAFSGEVAVGDRLLLSPAGVPVRVRGLHAQNREAVSGRAGERLALNLAGAELRRTEVHRGDWLVAEAAHAPARRLDAWIRVLPGEERALKHWTPAHLHLGAADVTGRIAVLEGREIAPGGAALVQLVLDRPIGALRGDRLILRDQSARRTMAGGMVVDPFPPERGRARPERLAFLQAMRQESPADALGELLDLASAGLDLGRFARAWNLTEDEAETLWASVEIAQVATPDGPVGLRPARWQGLATEVRDALAGWHARFPDSIGPDELSLRRALDKPVLPAVLRAAVTDLVDAGAVQRTGTGLHLPAHKPVLSPQDEALWREAQPLLAAGGRRPPRIRELAELLRRDWTEVEAFLVRAARLGLLLRVADNRFFPPDTVLGLAEIAEALAGEAEGGLFTAAAYRDRSGIGRNLTIELLEFFDKAGFTRRVGEGRQVLHPSTRLFGPPA